MIRFYYGENDFAIKKQIDALTGEFSVKYGLDSITRIDCQEIEPQKLIAELVNVSMFNPIRLIILSDLDKNNQAWTSFGDNIDRVPEDTQIVVSVKSPDKRTKTYKILTKSANSQEFKYLRGKELSDWLMVELQSRRLDFRRPAIDELISATSGDQWRLETEMGKFEVLDKVVDVDLVREFVEHDLESNAFIILDYSMSGRRSTAVTELSKLKQIEDPNKFFGLLASQFFALSAAVFGPGRDSSAGELKIHPFQLAKMGDLARKLGDNNEQRKRVRKASAILAKMDAKIKLSRPDEAWALIEIAISTI